MAKQKFIVKLDDSKVSEYADVKNHILLIKNAIKPETVAAALEKLKADQKDSTKRMGYISKYMGCPQLNWGVRDNNLPIAPYRRGKWLTYISKNKAIKQLIHEFIFSHVTLIQPLTKLESAPVLHGIYKSLDKNGAHVDTHSIDPETAYLRKCYTVLTYLNKPAEGGEIVFFDRNGGKHYPNPKIGDVIVFDSNILHDIEPFDGGKDYFSRVSLIIQYKENKDGEFTRFI